MRLIRLDEDMRGIVCAFDPYSLLEQQEYSKDDAYGIISEETDGYEGIVGLMLVRLKEGAEPVVEWLYVAPEHRCKGFAGAALDELVDVADTNGVGGIYISIRDYYGKELVYDYDEDFFVNRGFEEKAGLKGRKGETILRADTGTYIRLKDERELFSPENDDDYNDTLSDDFEEDYGYDGDDEDDMRYESMYSLRNDKAKKSSVKPRTTTLAELEKTVKKAHLMSRPVPVRMGELSLNELKEGITEALGHKAPSLLEDILSVSPDYFDPNMSCIIKDDGNTVGIILVHENLSTVKLEVCLFYAVQKKPDIVMKLFRNLVNVTKEEDYPGDVKVLVAF